RSLRGRRSLLGLPAGFHPLGESMSARRLWFGTALVVGTAAAVWGGWQALEARRVRAALQQAKQEMAAGRYQQAWKRLIGISPGRGGDGEVAYQLGLCELYRGHHAAALAAWERVPPG